MNHAGRRKDHAVPAIVEPGRADGQALRSFHRQTVREHPLSRKGHWHAACFVPDIRWVRLDCPLGGREQAENKNMLRALLPQSPTSAVERFVPPIIQPLMD